MDYSKQKLWTKDFIVVSSVNFFLTFIFYLLIVTMGVYAVDEFHASTSQAGLVTGIFIIGALLGRLFIGRKIDSFGRKKTLFIGLSIFTLTTIFYYMHLGITFLLFTRLIHGITIGVASTATGTIVAQIIPSTRKGEGIGYFSMSATLAAAFGPFIGIYLSQFANFQMIFAICLSLGFISFLTSLFLHVPEVNIDSKTVEEKGFHLANFVEPRALPIATITLLIAFCYSSVLSFINFYAIEVALVEAASFFFIVYSIAILLSRPFTGRLMDTKGANYVMYPAFIALSAGMFFLSIANTSVTFLLAAMLIGLGFGNIQSCTQAVAVKLTPSHRMGFATSTFFISLDAGLGFGPYLLGFIIPLTGYSSLYMLLGLLALLTALPYYYLHGKREHIAHKSSNASTSI